MSFSFKTINLRLPNRIFRVTSSKCILGVKIFFSELKIFLRVVFFFLGTCFPFGTLYKQLKADIWQ